MKELKIDLKQGKMHYYIDGAGPAIVFLHGWGQSFETFLPAANYLKPKYQIIGVDFLGFGKSDCPSEPLNVDDYANHVAILLDRLKIENPIIIAHSFGGRVALKYAGINNVEVLILVSSAGIKTHNLQYYYKVYRYKILKFVYRIFSKSKYLYLVENSGSTDYQNANPIMKRTLSKVVNYNSKKDMKLITSDTYLLWGIYDQMTPYEDCIKMNKLIRNSKIISFYNSEHFLYQTEFKKFINTLEKILSRNLWRR